jgi:hypothetical protein
MKMGKIDAAMLDRIIETVIGYRVAGSEQWLALSRDMPGVAYFATDLDPRSFEKVTTQGSWLGRAELLLKAPAELRPGQALQEVSFTMPVRVLLSERGGELSVEEFDFYSVEDSETLTSRIELEFGPPKTIGWGPFEGLIKE